MNDFILYTIACTLKQEDVGYYRSDNFIKVGITTQSLEERFDSMLFDNNLCSHYDFNKLAICNLPDYDSLLHHEREIHRMLRDKGFKVTPRIKFGGYSECFRYHKTCFTQIKDYITINELPIKFMSKKWFYAPKSDKNIDVIPKDYKSRRIVSGVNFLTGEKIFYKVTPKPVEVPKKKKVKPRNRTRKRMASLPSPIE